MRIYTRYQAVTMRTYGVIAISVWIFMWILYRRQLAMEMGSSQHTIVVRSENLDIHIDRNLNFRYLKHNHEIVLEGSFLDARNYVEKSRYFSHRNRRSNYVHMCGQNSLETCVNWNLYRLLIAKLHQNDRQIMCYNSSLRLKSPRMHINQNERLPAVCFAMKNNHWFSGAVTANQRWPIDLQNVPWQKFRSNRYSAEQSDDIGSIMERYFLISSRVGLFINREQSVDISISGGSICFRTSTPDRETPETIPPMKSDVFNYTICHSTKNVTHLHNFMMEKFLSKPQRLPKIDLLKVPVWSTEGHRNEINSDNLLSFVKDLKYYNLTKTKSGELSQLVINQIDYSTNIGDFDMDPLKFPPKDGGIRRIKELGCRIIIAVSPFVSVDSKSYLEGLKSGYFVRSVESDKPLLVKRGFSTWLAMVDFTHPDAQRWYLSKLINFSRKYGVTGFRAKHGEANYLPEKFLTYSRLPNPSIYSKLFVETVERFGGLVETSVAYRNQKSVVYTQIRTPSAKWGYNNGLKTVIPNILTLGLLGYPFVEPGFIGGFTNSDSPPRRDLYIRWMELQAYLPVMQFSVPPWKYDRRVVALSKKYIDIHERIVFPELLKAAKDALEFGSPLIRPVWWNSKSHPDDIRFRVDNQFLIGRNLMVVPVLDESPMIRYLYVPSGTWKDGISGRRYRGPKVYTYNYKIPLEEILTLRRVDK